MIATFRISQVRFLTFFVALVSVTTQSSVLVAQGENEDEISHFKSMQWRNVGPFRGGRAPAVAGVINDRLTYYFGSAGGGVWKTEDAGITWRNITTGFLNTSN